MGCERFRFYVFGRPFKLITDNRAVQLILRNTAFKPSARIVRMALRRSRIEQRPSVSNIANYYSRHPAKASPSAFLKEIKTEQ